MNTNSRLEVFIDRVPGETRLALTEYGKLKNLIIMSEGDKSLVGNVYFGRVEKILAGMNAAFVDIGVGISAFLPANDGQILGLKNEKPELINKLYKEGDKILVQVSRDGSGHKGARLTTRINLVGRTVIIALGRLGISISKGISDQVLCQRLKYSIRNLENPALGLIVRTNAQCVPVSNLQKEAKKLSNEMLKILSLSKDRHAPTCLYRQSDQILNFLRDFGSKDWQCIIVNDRPLLDKIKKYLRDYIPELNALPEFADDPKFLFKSYDLEEQIIDLYEPIVQLPSGGRLIIEETEALVAVDVDSGSYNRESDPETFAVSVNKEAAIEFSRQLILRNLTGQIVLDFLPMKKKKNKNYIQRKLFDLLIQAKNCHIFGFSKLGLLEINRQRVGESLFARFWERGGARQTTRVIVVDMVRAVLREIHHNPGKKIKIVCSQNLYAFLKRDTRAIWDELVARTGPIVSIEKSAGLKHSYFEVLVN